MQAIAGLVHKSLTSTLIQRAHFLVMARNCLHLLMKKM